MKVSIDVRMLHSSGIGVYLQNLAPRIIRSHPGDRFALMGDPKDRQDPVWEGLANVDWVDCGSPIYSLGQRFEFKRKLPKDADLYWSPHYDTATFAAPRTLVTVHDLFHLAMGEHAGGWHRRLYARWMFDRVAREADAIVVISEFTRSELERLVGADERKVHKILNGLDEGWRGPTSQASPHPRPYFLYVGNIKPHKNLKRLLEAFALVKDSLPYDLLLIGQREGFLSGDEQVQRQALAFSDRVKFTGTVPLDRLRAYYGHAVGLVFPSLYEGFGMPPLEAMACGCPVVASVAASIPEVCGEAALFFDPLDPKDMAAKMMTLVEDGTREELVRRGRERAKAFSWDLCADEMSNQMERMLASRAE